MTFVHAKSFFFCLFLFVCLFMKNILNFSLMYVFFSYKMGIMEEYHPPQYSY